MNENMDAKVNLLVRSEKALLKMEMRKRSRQAVFIAIGLIAVLAALVMLNIALYLYLESNNTPLVSVVILAGINVVTAVLFFLIASRQEMGSEAESMREIRDFAWSQVSDDIDEVKQNVTEFKNSMQRVSSGVNSVFSRDFFGLKGLMPIITALLETQKKK